MLVRWLRWVLVLVGCLVGVGLCLTWWFTHATPNQYRHFFNVIYGHFGGAFTHEPNRLVVETASTLPPGRALDIAMGEGRNAVYLASQGWDVTGFDVSDEALRQATDRAREAGVHIRVLRGTSETFDYGRDRWDLILLSYAFAPVRDPAYVERLRDALRPGGVLVFEHYLRLPATGNMVGTAGRGELPRLFSGFEIRKYQELEASSDWQGGRRAPLARLVAVKRGNG